MLIVRAGSAEPKAVPLSLITRLEEVDVSLIEMSNGRAVMQYRGALIPLVPVSRTGLRAQGTQPLLVFSDDQRTMALMVDEIVDIAQEPLRIEVASDQPGIVGSAIIKGKATEILDVGHYLPLAFEDWFGGNAASAEGPTRQLLLVDDSPFFRNMLAPVLQAAGYEVKLAASGQDAIALLRDAPPVDVVVTDTEMPEMDGFALCAALRADVATRHVPVVAMSSAVSDDALARGRACGVDYHVAKFDRAGLISALKDHSAKRVAER